MTVPLLRPLWLLVLLAAAPPPRLVAQQGEPGDAGGVMTGLVVDASSGRPLGGALVALEFSGDAAVVRPGGSGVFLSRGVTGVTGEDGIYRLGGLGPGPYRLLVRLLGYREAVLDVDLTPATFRLSVGLVMNPIRLAAIDVESSTGQVFARTRSALEESRFGRTEAERQRQDFFLESDARMLTQSDVTEAVTLGESDLLRALQRLPGVSARDDYTAGLWTRGAPWAQTRAYYDGMPLFNPVHAFGLLSSLSPDAIGLASFHPGVRSAAFGEGAAGVLALTSRSADRPGLHGLAELSVTSARAALDAGSRDGRYGLVLSARRSYIDLATRLAQLAGGDSAVYIPYAFTDVTARGDARLGPRTGVELSGLWTEDAVRGRLRNLLERTRGSWGNQVAQATVVHATTRIQSRTTMGVSRFAGLINPPAPEPGPVQDAFQQAETGGGATIVVPQHGSTANRLMVMTAATALSQPSGARRPPWALGAQLVHYGQAFGGQLPRAYPVSVLPDTLLLDEALVVPGVWGEFRWSAGGWFALETGVRAERPHQGTRNVPGVALAPRLTARATAASGRATFSAGGARSFQYTQALAPAGPSIGPDLYLTDVWLLAGDTIPAIRADIATVGGEVALPGAWVAGATAYVRRSTGVALPDPEPGPLDSQRPIFVTGTNTARGLELGVRRIVGRLTASAAYTLARSMVEAGGYRYPSSADRRHTVDATAMFRVTPGLRLGAALTAGSGTPYSRVHLGTVCDTAGRCSADTLALSIEEPNRYRTPMYASLDLLLDWEGTRGRARIGAFFQLRNLLNRSNAVTYTGTIQPCVSARPLFAEIGSSVCDRFDRGVPLLPLAGVRIAF